MSHIEQDLKQAQSDIQTLVVSVTKLSVMMENAEKRHDTDVKLISDAVKGINALQEKVATAINLEKDINIVRESLLELKGDIRTARHDLNTALNTLQAIPVMNKQLAEQAVKIEALETWRDEIKGAANAGAWIGRVLWAVFGTGFLAVAFFVLKSYFSGGDNVGY